MPGVEESVNQRQNLEKYWSKGTGYQEERAVWLRIGGVAQKLLYKVGVFQGYADRLACFSPGSCTLPTFISGLRGA